jgi:hypothetical protein
LQIYGHVYIDSISRKITYIKRAIVKPYISLYRDDTIGEGSVKWLGPPIVIVGMNIFRHNPLCQVGRVVIQRAVANSKNILDILRERNIRLAENERGRQE